MESIDKAATRYLTQEQPAHLPKKTPKNRLSDSVISKIFLIFKADYGTAWVSQFTTQEALETTKARWSVMLAHLTPAEIKAGLDNMGKFYKEYPPKLYQFIELCESYGKRRRVYWKIQPKPQSNKALASKAIAQMRKKLKMKKKK